MIFMCAIVLPMNVRIVRYVDYLHAVILTGKPLRASWLRTLKVLLSGVYSVMSSHMAGCSKRLATDGTFIPTFGSLGLTRLIATSASAAPYGSNAFTTRIWG